MSRAEKFIKSKIRIGSNTSSNGWRRKGVFIPSYSLPWLSPDDARKAVEIAREEVIDKVKKLLLSEVLPCFMHGGEADEVVAMMDEKLLKDE